MKYSCQIPPLTKEEKRSLAARVRMGEVMPDDKGMLGCPWLAWNGSTMCVLGVAVAEQVWEGPPECGCYVFTWEDGSTHMRGSTVDTNVLGYLEED